MPAEQQGSVYATKHGYGIRWLERGRRQHASGFASRSEARRYFREQVRPRLRGETTIDPRRTTFADFAEIYLEQHPIEPLSLKTLRQRLRRPVREFGHLTLAELERRPQDIARWRTTLPPGTAHAIMQALRQTLERAVAWRVIVTNPAKAAGPNKPAKRSEIRPFTDEELCALLVELGEWAPMVAFAAETGLRPGEWIALEGRDLRLDEDEPVVRVERTYGVLGLKTHGKTEGSRRSVPLSSAAIVALERLPRRAGGALVFPGARGGYLDLSNFRSREWGTAIEAADLGRRRTPYSLRHTFATNALASGIPAFHLSRYMGTSMLMIDKTYGHLTRDRRSSARTLLDARSNVVAYIWRDAPELVGANADG